MGATHFLTRTLGRVSTEMSLQVLAYNLKRVLNILGGLRRGQRTASRQSPKRPSHSALEIATFNPKS
jgi:hypothetical protein